MIFVLLAVAWFVVALAAALLVGRAVHLADRWAPLADHLAGLPAELTVSHVLGTLPTQPTVH